MKLNSLNLKVPAAVASVLLALTSLMITVALTRATPQVGRAYGIAAGSGLSHLTSDELKTRLNGIKATGSTWVRFDISWADIQPDNAQDYQWQAYDQIFAASQQTGLKTLGIISYTPEWARPSGCQSDKCAPADTRQFATFAAAVAKRYMLAGAHYWEIWNEPNNPSFWQPSPNIGQYSALLKASDQAIKTIDPKAYILTGGLSPQATSTNSYAPADFLSGLYDAGAKPYFNAISDHPYTFPLSPASAERQAWNQMSDSQYGLRQIMLAHGDGNKKIWITEFGAPTGGPGTVATLANLNLAQHPYVVDEALQGQILSDAIKLYRGYNWAGPFFWYSYQDVGTSAVTNENFFGLLRYDGTHKPAYDIFLRATNNK